MHDPEGYPSTCCPKKIHIAVARAGGLDVVPHEFSCGFGRVFQPDAFGVLLKFEHGIQPMTEQCQARINELAFKGPRNTAELTTCTIGVVSCRAIWNGEPAAPSENSFPEISCDGEIPAFSENEANQYGILRFPLTLKQGAVIILEKMPESGGRNHAVFHFQAVVDPQALKDSGVFPSDEYTVEVAGSCECEPYIAPPETDCAPDEYE